MTDSTVGEWGDATATFSADRTHRYLLTRTWDRNSPTVNFLMLNPSTADAFVLDPTNRRCMGFARDWGYGCVTVTNIFGFRSTDPKDLRVADDPVGPDNDAAILDAAGAAQLVIAAWGVHGELLGRAERVRSMLTEAGVKLHALRLTKDGHPGHPLYVPASTKPTCWA